MTTSTPTRTDLPRLLAAHGVSATPWFAILDAAQDDTLPEKAAAAGLQIQSLYEGKIGRQLDDVAPHLVSLSLNGQFAASLFEAWDGNRCVLLQTAAGFKDLRRHLRKFLMVKDEAGKRYRFRFYDPRVLRAFLPVCSYDEAKDFFGPIAAYYAADPTGQSAIAFYWRARGLAVKELTPRKP